MIWMERMKSICVTGFLAGDQQAVYDVFIKAGMQSAVTASQDESLNLSVWHQRVIDSVGDKGRVIQPGNFYVQLAKDIFWNNDSATVWGWQHSQSAWLLDFWVNFEKHTHFVLVCTSPQKMLVQYLLHAQDTLNQAKIAHLLQDWHAYHQQLLRFYKRYPTRCILIDANISNTPSALITQCNKEWQLALVANQNFANTHNHLQQDDFLYYLVEQYCAADFELILLQQEIEANLLLMTAEKSNEQVNGGGDLLDLFSVIKGYVSLNKQFLQEKAKTAGLSAKLHDIQEDNTQLLVDKEQHSIKLTQQVHCLEEQLTNLKQQADQKQRQVEQLEAAQQKIHQEHQQQLDIAAKAQSAMSSGLEKTEKENELLLLQVHQVQEELEHYFLQAQDVKQQLHVLKSSRKQLIEQHNQQLKVWENDKQNFAQNLQNVKKKIHSEYKQHLQLATQQRLSVESKLQHYELENELMLAQLHQVQGELEYYFSQYQDISGQICQEQLRWQRMLARNPTYTDYEGLQVLGVQGHGHEQITQWQVLNLESAGVSFKSLVFETRIKQGLVLFRLQCADLHGQTDLAGDSVQQNQQQYCDLSLDKAFSSRDFRLLNVLPNLIIKILSNPKVHDLPEILAKDLLLNALQNLQLKLNDTKPVFRFDKVQLYQEQLNPDYEHLWLRFKNISFAKENWPIFECRLACANISPEQFGSHPKLEFPVHDRQQVLENWFAESKDDFGDKLELRFALPEAIDIAVWQQLSARDHVFIMSLIEQMPLVLTILQQERNIQRSWSEWLAMVNAMKGVFQMHHDVLLSDMKFGKVAA